jgi:hypothetical protein
MLKQQSTSDISSTNRDQVGTHVNKIQSPFTHSARIIIAELCDHHAFECDAEHLEFVHSLLAVTKYHLPVAEHVAGGVCGPNPRHRVSKFDKDRPAST